MINKKILWVIFVIFGAGSISFWYYFNSIKKNIPRSHYINDNLKPVFHSSQVKSLLWQVKGESFFFQRENSSSIWSPKANYKKISQTLNFLARAHSEKLVIDEDPLINIEVTFFSGEKWRGGWQNNNFLWLTGPKKGFGSGLRNSFQNLLFLSGKVAFVSSRLNWCPDRLDTLRLGEEKNKSLTIYRVGPQWFGDYNKREKIASKSMEEWIFKYCDIKIDQYIDPGIKSDSFNKINDWLSLEANFKGEDSLTLSYSKKAKIFRAKNLKGQESVQLFTSKELEKAFGELKEIRENLM